VSWLSEGTAIVIDSAAYEELRIANRALVLRDWGGDEEILAEHEELLGDGPPLALVVRDPSRPTIAVLVGEEGSELLKLDSSVQAGLAWQSCREPTTTWVACAIWRSGRGQE
jgi:hypothetical protein